MTFQYVNVKPPMRRISDATLFYHCVLPNGRQWADKYGRRYSTKQEAEAYKAQVQRRFEIVMGVDPAECRWVEDLAIENPGDP